MGNRGEGEVGSSPLYIIFPILTVQSHDPKNDLATNGICLTRPTNVQQSKQSTGAATNYLTPALASTRSELSVDDASRYRDGFGQMHMHRQRQ